MLGELEQVVLLGVLRAGDDAYGVRVLREIRQRAGRDLALATVHKTLSRLEAKGLVASRVGEPTPERGGRRKRYYAVTAAGRRDLRHALGALGRMARGLELGWDAP
ncbi:MAG TPA: helix-turn-helix transcriptional regulator [Gemmatimonadaceae bacterium]|nr:helix-turn-helix transcriptional regulator [Gemmatimonadaceae bacterium]